MPFKTCKLQLKLSSGTNRKGTIEAIEGEEMKEEREFLVNLVSSRKISSAEQKLVIFDSTFKLAKLNIAPWRHLVGLKHVSLIMLYITTLVFIISDV